MQLRLISRSQENEDTINFFWKPATDLEWQAGQFMRYTLPDPQSDDRGTKRYFTIAAAPFEKNLRITTRITAEKGSSFKKDLLKLEVGDEIEAEGPMGSFVLDDPSKNYIFVAGGIGITPFRAILKNLEHQQKPLNITLLYANRNDQIVFKDELDQITQNHPEFKIQYIIDPQKIDAQTLQPTAQSLSPIYYLSGPKPMVEAIEQILKDLNIGPELIKTDYFPGYNTI